MNKTLTSFLAVIVAAPFVATVSETNAAEWGSLKGRFVIDGKAPELPPLKVDDKDPFCQKAKPVNKAVVTGKDGALANVIVYLRLPRGKKIATVHPDYETQLKEPKVLDNVGCSFEPHVILVRVGQPLLIKNSDPTGHNTKIDVFAFNQIIPAKEETEIKATRESPLPSQVQCNIHPFMQAWLLAQSHPYMAASGEDGSFEIKNIPAGKHEFQFWHEAAGYLGNVKFKGGATNRQGRADLSVAANQTLDLGDIKVPASVLKVR